MATDSLVLNVSTDKYSVRISTLQGYVKSLQGIVEQYSAQRNKIDEIWNATEAEEYKKVIDQNIAKVNESIEAANLNISQIEKLVQNMQTTKTGIQTIVTEAGELAQNLFN